MEGNSLFFRVLYDVLCTAVGSVKYGDDSGCVVDHPFVPFLEGRRSVRIADETDEVGLVDECLVPLLPFPRPSVFNARKWNGSDEPDSWIVLTQTDYDFTGPDIDPIGHSRDESGIPTANGRFDFLFQLGYDFFFCAGQLLRPVAGEAAAVLPHFLFALAFDGNRHPFYLELWGDVIITHRRRKCNSSDADIMLLS